MTSWQLRWMRLLQFSDPHLLADPQALCRGRPPLGQLRQGLAMALRHCGGHAAIDLLLISGDLCHDESWLGYAQLRDLLQELGVAAAVLPGNHDQPMLLRAALVRQCSLAPALVEAGPLDLLLLDSHRPGCEAGLLGGRQLAWVERILAGRGPRPLLVVLHHPPVPIGDPGFDAIGLLDAEPLLELLRPVPALQAVLFGHIHQHWQGLLPGRPASLSPVPLLGCPSSLCGFGPVQPCPLGRAHDPGARLLLWGSGGLQHHQLLRWPAQELPSLGRPWASLAPEDL